MLNSDRECQFVRSISGSSAQFLAEWQVIEIFLTLTGSQADGCKGREARIEHHQGKNEKSRLKPHPRATFHLPSRPPFSPVEFALRQPEDFDVVIFPYVFHPLCARPALAPGYRGLNFGSRLP